MTRINEDDHVEGIDLVRAYGDDADGFYIEDKPQGPAHIPAKIANAFVIYRGELTQEFREKVAETMGSPLFS